MLPVIYDKLGKLSKLKSRKLWTRSKVEMTPCSGFGIFLNFKKKLNMKHIGTKSINMIDIMVYLAMLSTTIDKILCFLGPHKMKMSHYFISL